MIKVAIEQRHIDNGLRCSTADPIALAIQEELDKLPVPPPYIRVERVVSVASSVIVTEHRIIKRKGREETDLAWQRYWFGEPIKTQVGDKIHETYDLHHPVFDFMVAYGNGERVGPITIDLVPRKE